MQKFRPNPDVIIPSVHFNKIPGDLCAHRRWERAGCGLWINKRSPLPQPQLGDTAHLLPARQCILLEGKARGLR